MTTIGLNYNECLLGHETHGHKCRTNHNESTCRRKLNSHNIRILVIYIRIFVFEQIFELQYIHLYFNYNYINFERTPNDLVCGW